MAVTAPELIWPHPPSTFIHLEAVMAITKQDALDYHNGLRPGKVEVVSTKPCLTQRDLSLAYTPGVAVPCLAIERDPSLAYKYTSKGNLVGVVTNGTAIISGAALLNALEIAGKDIGQVRVVFNGAGASAIACAKHYMRLGVHR